MTKLTEWINVGKWQDFVNGKRSIFTYANTNDMILRIGIIINQKEVTMNPIVDMAVNVILSALFAFMKAQGLSEEEAKTKLWEKVDQIEKLPPLPMDI